MRRGFVRPYVARDAVHLLERHVQLVAVGIFQQEVIALTASYFLAHDGREVRDAVRRMHNVVAWFEGERDLGHVHATPRFASAPRVHASVQICDGKHRELRLRNHDARRQRQVDKRHASARNRGNGVHRHPIPAKRDCPFWRVQGAGVERIGVALEQRHVHMFAQSARVLGCRLQRFLERDPLVAQGKLERLARAAVGRSEHASKAVRRKLAYARDEARIGTRDRRLLDFELGRHRTAGADDRDEVQPLLSAEIQLLRAQVQPVEMRDPRLAGAALDILIRAHAIIEQRPRLGKHHERASAHVRKRALGTLVHERQVTIELGCHHARIGKLKLRRKLRVALGGLVERHMQAMHHIVGQGELAAWIDLHTLVVADRLTGRSHHAPDTVDLVTEKLNAHGRRALRGKHVDRIAVYAKEPRCRGFLCTRVAHAHQTLWHILERMLFPHGKRYAPPVAALRRRHASQKRPRRGDDDARLASRQALERRAAHSHHGIVRLLIHPWVVLALGKARDMFDTHVGSEPARGTLGRVLTRDDIHHGARATCELRREHEHTAGLRYRERSVLAGVERPFDDARRFGSKELCGNTMNEHATPSGRSCTSW